MSRILPQPPQAAAVALAAAAALMGQPAAAAPTPAPAAAQAATAAPTIKLAPGTVLVPMTTAPAPARARPAAPAATPAAPPCQRVTSTAPIALGIGKTHPYHPPLPVQRILLGGGGSTAGIPGGDTQEATGPGMPPGGAAAGGAAAAGAAPVGEVDVQLLSPNDLFLVGRRMGSTNFVLVHGGGACTTVDVNVGVDPGALQAVIGQVLPAEKDIKVTAAFDSLVLQGTVSDADALARVTDLAHAYLRGSGQQGAQAGGAAKNPRIVNMLELGSPQQVMLEVKVAEVSKTLLDQFGIDFSRAYVPGDGSMLRFLNGVFGGAAGVFGQISGTNRGVPYSSVDTVIGGTIGGTSGNGAGNTSVSGGNVTMTLDNMGRPVYTTSYGTVPGRGVSNVTANMQKTDGAVKILAEPSVMAISGQTGSFLAGGKIFIPVATNTDGGQRTVTLEEKEFGVSVVFTPTVLGSGRINLKVKPEVSELNPGGVTVSGIGGTAVLPAFTSRRAQTTVQLMDGQSFAIGGLIKNNTTTNIKAFPMLGEVPVLGALFRSTEFQQDRSELVFVITPRLVRPLPSDYRLPTDNYTPPSRFDLQMNGRTEGKAPAEPAVQAPEAAAPAAAAHAAKGGFDMKAPEGTR